MDNWTLIIAASSVVILSFIFNIVSNSTKIPSVLMLILLGVGLQGLVTPQYRAEMLSLLPIIGNIGLVMIVLEAALDLELEKRKMGLIGQTFLVALLGLIASSVGIAYLLKYSLDIKEFSKALAYAIPLSIMSSAIIIPSVSSLKGRKKEFMVYEGTFSDILGIMFFYFLMGSSESTGTGDLIGGITLNIVLTLIMAAVVAYSLVYLFQHIKTQVKLFLVIAVLILMYALGKKFHLSSLIVILAFGLVLNNTNVFFRGRLNKYVNEEASQPLMHDFHTLTLETAFVVRTFFFVIFGITIDISSLLDLEVFLISMGVLGILYAIRLITLLVSGVQHVFPELFLAPRGLITILLFFAIVSEHPEFIIPGFNPGILLYTILISSIIMAIALISHRGEKVQDVVKENIKELAEIPISLITKKNQDQIDRIKENQSSRGKE